VHTFIVYGEPTSFNDYINAERTNRYIAAKIKKEETAEAAACASSLPKITGKNFYTFHWFTETERKDPDSCSIGMKCIFDGLVAAGIIENDGRKQISGYTCLFSTDKENPRVEITITPAD
jgi:hypothetical protein